MSEKLYRLKPLEWSGGDDDDWHESEWMMGEIVAFKQDGRFHAEIGHMHGRVMSVGPCRTLTAVKKKVQSLVDNKMMKFLEAVK